MAVKVIVELKARAGQRDALRSLIEQLGGGTPEVIDAGVPGAPGHRLVLVRKERPTPVGYPRVPAVRRGRPGRPAKDGDRTASRS